MLSVNLPNKDAPPNPPTGMLEGIVQLHSKQLETTVSTASACESRRSPSTFPSNLPDGTQDEDQRVAVQPLGVEAGTGAETRAQGRQMARQAVGDRR